ncbi:MAG: NAD(P)-dependent oxidoreductase [bacterium]|nr:NAD(P)-dependent oxidoreductase [bacterium]
MGTEERAPVNVFVTGASSPLGLAVVRALAADGHKVTGMTDGKDGAIAVRAAGGLPVFSDPLSASEIKAMMKMSKAEIVVHLDNFSSLPFRSQLDPERIKKSAIAITSAAEGAGAKYLVALSYAFVYATESGHDSHEGHDDHGGHDAHGAHGHGHAAPTLLTEDAATAVVTENSLLKAALHADATLQEANIPACILRTGFVYGPRLTDTEVLAETLRAGRSLPAGESHTLANWVHLDDLAQAVRLVVNRPPTDTTYNIVDDKPMSPADFLAQFAKSMGLQVPGRMPGFLSRVLGGRTSSALLELSAAASNAKARDELGWKPTYPTAEKGIEHTLFIWRSEMQVRS